MARPLRKIATLKAIDFSGFATVLGSNPATETGTLTATLSDGRLVTYPVKFEYKRLERERIMEAIARGQGSESEVRSMQNLLLRRQRTVLDGYAYLQRTYGNGVVVQ